MCIPVAIRPSGRKLDDEHLVILQVIMCVWYLFQVSIFFTRIYVRRVWFLGISDVDFMLVVVRAEC